MAAAHEDSAEVGFEEGMLWLPSHVLDEACDTKVMRERHQCNQQQRLLRHRKSLGEPQTSQCPVQQLKSRSRSCQWPKLANGGPGMQVIFLGSGERSCGTGVFLPQMAGTNFQSSKKPACAPVLLPARVVQALNLNVQALGLQVTPRKGAKCNPRCVDAFSNNNSTNKKIDHRKDASKQQCGVISQSQSSSAEVFLPKEWTY